MNQLTRRPDRCMTLSSLTQNPQTKLTPKPTHRAQNPTKTPPKIKKNTHKPKKHPNSTWNRKREATLIRTEGQPGIRTRTPKQTQWMTRRGRSRQADDLLKWGWENAFSFPLRCRSGIFQLCKWVPVAIAVGILAWGSEIRLQGAGNVSEGEGRVWEHYNCLFVSAV